MKAALALLAATCLQAAPLGAYTVEELARAVAVAVGEGGNETEKMRGVAKALERFLDGGTIEEAATTPHPGLDVTTVLLYAAPDGSFSIAALVIRPGARTPIHDHGTWTVWGTLRGEDRETRFELRAGGAPTELVPVATQTLTGTRLSLLAGAPRDIHRLENVGATPSISIHVHGADMTRQTRNAYDEKRRTVTPFVQSYVELRGGGE